jgi:uncharacterized protein DUF3108
MQRDQKFGRPRHLGANALVVAGLLIAFAATGGSSETKNQSSNAPCGWLQNSANVTGGCKFIAEKSPLAAPVPFRIGEILNYRLTWSVFSNAAAVQLAVIEKRDLFGTATWHFRASAHTQVPLRSLAEIDDQFDSYADTANLESKQYETYLNELGEKQDTVSQLVSTSQPNKNHASVVLVRPHTRDPLAALYALRAIDWRRTPEFRAPVYDGEDLYEMRARIELNADVVNVAGRDMKATKILVQLFQGAHQSRTQCFIWFSQDAASTPVLLQAQVPYGSVRAELLSKIE